MGRTTISAAVVAVVLGVCIVAMGVALEDENASDGAEKSAHAYVLPAIGEVNGRVIRMGGWSGSKFSNSIFELLDNGSWKRVLDQAPWRPRTYFSAATLDDRIYIFGGFAPRPPSNVLGDVWSSTNGIGWRQEASDAAWEEREHYGVGVLNEKIYLYGGVTYFRPAEGSDARLRAFSDVWSSVDGYRWELENGSAPWKDRRGFGFAVHDGHIWLFGGFDSRDRPHNDVWKSADGKSWNLVSSSAPWRERGTLAHLAFDGQLWVLGGNSSKKRSVNGEGDVWASTDGIVWVPRTLSAPWEARAGAVAFPYTHEGREVIALYGGFNDFDGAEPRRFYGDTWVSENGEDWEQLGGATDDD